MSNKQLSITTQYTLRFFIHGIFWLLYSVLSLANIKVVQIIGCIFLMIAAVCTASSLLPNREPDDEMSLEHIRKAKSFSLDWSIILLTGIGIVSLLPQFTIDFSKVYGFVVAASQIITGVLFHIYEKEGF